MRTLSNTLQIYRESNSTKGITFITPKEEFFSYRELASNALKFLTYFREVGLKKDSKLIFQLSYNKNFVHSFWACVAGGVVAVPVTTGNNDEHRQKLFNIYSLLDDAYLIVDSDILDKLEIFAKKNHLEKKFLEIKAKTIDISTIDLANLSPASPIESQEDDLALIQFSSGSTGEPKGVMLTHLNIIENGRGVLETAQITKQDSYLSWFSLTHDMGLMGYHINPIILGVNQVLIETNIFIRRPLIWLEAASKFKSTILCSPNFGYKYLLKFLKKEQQWNLENIRLIFNGAEPISATLCDEFLEKLKPYGLKKEAMYPVYGLSEATVGVAFTKPGEIFKRYTLDINHLSIGEKVRDVITDVASVTYVDVGYPLINMQMRITNNNIVLNENFIGHLELKSISVTKGYYKNPEATKVVLKEDGWLDTGDLAFIRDGRLIITGRAKDIIIKNGVNYYPHDIEEICCEVEACELNKVVAIGSRDKNQEDEELVIFVLFKKEIDGFLEIEEQIKQSILKKIGLEVAHVIPIKTVYKTTSGKLQRFKLLKKYQDGEFKESIQILESLNKKLFELESSSVNNKDISYSKKYILKVLTKEANDVLESEVHKDKPLFEQGFSSITLMVFKNNVSKQLKIQEIASSTLFNYPTLMTLSDYLFESLESLKINFNKKTVIVNKTGVVKATSFQKRLFILSQFENSEDLYNLSIAWETEKLNIKKCERIFQELLKVHISLNINLYLEGDILYQKLNNHEFILNTIELNENSVDEVISTYIAKSFDLENDLLFSVLIIQDNKKDYLILKTHHTIFDGSSANIIMQDFKRLYSNESVIQSKKDYFDFSVAYNSLVQSKKIEQQEKFWLNHFKVEPSLLALPINKAYPSVRTYKGDKVYFTVNEALTKEIKELAKSYNVSVNMLLFASFTILLHKISSQDDISIGVPSNNRDNEYSNTVGMFINTLALRQELDTNMSVEAYMKSVHKLFLEVLDNRDYPLEELVAKLNIKKDLARNMLFDVMFAYEDGLKRVMDELNFQKYEIKDKYADFDLTLEVLDEGDSLRCSFKYYTEVFNESTIKRFSTYYLKTLTEIQDNKFLKDIDIIPLEEKSLLDSFNKTEEEYPQDKTIIELFEEQVERTPHNIAVVYEEKELSYLELNNRANSLAHYLVELGVKPNDLVAICMDRSIEMMIALLGILKSKGAYVPVDSSSPIERMGYMLQDSKAKIVLTQDSLVNRITSLTESKIIRLDDSDSISNQYPSYNLNKEINLDHLAYVIYTSGSTGRPKGTLLTHKNLNNYLYWSMNEYQPRKGIGIPVQSSLAFDATITSLYLPILTGGKTILLAEKEEIEGLSKLLKESDPVSLIKITPSHLKILNQQLTQGEFSNATHALILGGEALSFSDIEPWLEYAPKVHLINEYGPTESVVGCCVYDAIGNTTLSNSIPIGKPIANTRLYILNKNQQNQPIGSIGELYIGGDGLARGYLNKPELTDKVFINHPELGRIYKTGDMAKYQEDGNIEYLGRVDDQVKIRGYRIELGEIESSILSFKEIKEAVVIAKEQQLIAYVVENKDGLSKESMVTERSRSVIEELKRKLKNKLPSYMIPSYFVKLEGLPLNSNGKIDKKALPEPNYEESSKAYIEPENEKEEIVVEAFLEVLSIKKISTEDNFFEIGGDSIKAIQITSKIASKGYRLDIKSIFKSTSIKELATYVEKTKRVISQKSLEGSIGLNPIQKWFFELNVPKNHFNQSVLLKMKEEISKEILERVVKQLQIHHDMLRVNYTIKDNSVIQLSHDIDFPIDVEVVVLKSTEEIEEHANRCQSLFDIEVSSLMKVVVFKVENESDRVLIILHHLIVDGVSWRILLEDLNNAYSDSKKGLKTSLPLKTDSFKAYIDALEKYGRGIVIQLNYWKELTSSVRSLPTDNEVSVREARNKRLVNFNLSKEETRNLLEETNFAYNTQINDVLLTALTLALYKSFKMEESLITLEGHGREELLEVDVSRTVGWFTTAYPVRLKYVEKTLEHQIKYTKESLRAVPDKGIGYGVLKYIGEHDLGYEPQVSFNYLGEFDNSLNNDFFELASESAGESVGEDFISEYKLDINAIITNDEFSLSVAYDQFEFNEKRIDVFKEAFKDTLLEVIEHCQFKESTVITPSDISDDDFDIESLNEFLSDFNEGRT